MNQNLLDIHTIVIHCSATIEGKWYDASDIDRWHKSRTPPFSMIGYHKVVLLDGRVEDGRPFTRRGAHVAGNNMNTLGFCMIGGLDENKKPKDTFNNKQKSSLFAEILKAKGICPNIKRICGHRDFSPDLNGDGLITPDEWIKDCPCFDVHKWIEVFRKYGYDI